MLKLYDVIYNLINPIVDSYSEHYPDTEEEKQYPYAEINFPNIAPNNEYSDLIQFEIDIWDNKSGQVEEIETIVDNLVKQILNGKNNRIINTGDMLIQIYKNAPFRMKLPDKDINIQRRELRFLIKFYERN